MQTLLPEDPMIFGRDHVFERLLQRTEGLLAGYRQNMALIGPEGTGKSSTLERIQEVIRCEDLIVIRIGTAPEEFRSFAERFIARLFFQALLKKGMRARDVNGTLLSRSGKFFPRTQQSARDIVRLARRDPTTAFGRLFELPGTLHAETGWSSVVMLDEFDRLEGYNLKDPFQIFGQKIMLEKRTMYIVTSSRPHHSLMILREKLNLLFGQFEVLRLNGLGLESSRELLNAQIPSPLSTPHVKFLVSLTGGHPLYLKRIGNALHAHTFGEGRGPGPAPDGLACALETELHNPNGSLYQRFTRAADGLPQPRPAVYLSVLAAIAAGKNTCAGITRELGRNRRDVSRQLARLIQMDLVAKSGQFYRLPDPLFKFWLKNVHAPALRQADTDPGRARDQFHASVRSAYTVFQKADEIPIPERVRELFTLFRNETVQLNHRQHKLPHFQEIFPSRHNGHLPIYARRGAGFWAGQIANGHMTEADVSRFAENCKKSRLPVKRKIIISQKPLNLNASLVAKEGKMWMWDLDDLNLLLDLYGKPPIIT